MTATPPEIHPDYDPDVWALGYQARQFGVAGDTVADAGSVYPALATPSSEMTAAFATVPDHELPTT
jgi:hypothetical protein